MSRTFPPKSDNNYKSSQETHTVTPFVHLLTNTRPCSSQLFLLNGHTVIETHVGNLQLTLDITLDSVLCVTSFTYNLLSVYKLLSTSSFIISFTNTSCILQDLIRRKETEIGRSKDGLYVFSKSRLHIMCPENTNICNNFSTKLVTVELLHAGLGHVPLKVLKLLNISCLMHELPTCDTCHIAKQSRMKFDNNSYKSLSFDLVHADLWGPYQLSL